MIFIIPAALLIGVGALIRYKKTTWLISGYNTASKEKKSEYDIDKLCYHTSNFLFREAAIFLIMALFVFLFDDYFGIITAVGFIVIIIFTIIGLIYMNTSGRVKK